MVRSSPEAAVATGDDPRDYARLLAAVYDATMAGDRAPARPRAVIAESWEQLMADGVDPARHRDPLVESDELDALRRRSGLVGVLEEMSRGLGSLTADGDNIVVVADSRGRVLWRSGHASVLQRADSLGFVEGAHWGEGAVGTNAIGTALVSRQSVQIFSAEHYQPSHHTWTCAGAPIRDPRTGRVLGVVDVSGPAATVHPTTVTVVDLVARLAESRLRETHDRLLNEIRAVSAPILAAVAAPALAVDTDGWVAAVGSVPVCTRLQLPGDPAAGPAWVPTIGWCDFEPLPGGWLVRVVRDGAARDESVTTVVVDLIGEPTVRVSGRQGRWHRIVSRRHAQILRLLAQHPAGRSAAELSVDLYGDDGHTVTVRAEMSRLRRQLPGLVAARPYRCADGVVMQLRPDGVASDTSSAG
ncbi:helix-turn-helix domain-containing protein [Williamsia sterculiae]|uniref:GAF domain-containing protein n=1 Tax=Williamsia sterculiae TaxID=1344003 RepID=A0A1N7HG49_9NOCA|nr:helix-turn-helix domain-containing protein [Williamsia sterculiae]SIS23648.1 GAF domain-containing protein [Williamsia sterculiae]